MMAVMNTRHFPSTAALLGALCVPLSALAQQTPQPASAAMPAQEPGYTWALGLAASNGPDYAGSDERGSNLRPVIGLDIGRYTLSSGGGGSLLDFDLEPRYTGVSARLLDAERLKLSAGLRIGGGRTHDADSPLYGLPDVRKTLRARLSATWMFSPELSLRSSLNQDLLGRKGGTTLQTTLQYEWQITPSTEIGLAAGFTLADSTHLRSFFGVPADVALVRTPFAAYAPGGGVKSSDLGVEIKSAITDRWVVFGGVRFSQLRGDARNSPIVQKPNDYGVTVGLAYRCCK
jgi:outer membrane scaffolding protein for murein synthesis (MipA/OmpV family)